MTKTYKIAFIYLDEIHHLYHFITVAHVLSKTHEVSILTFPAAHSLLHKTLRELENKTIKVEKLPTLAFRAFTDKFKGRKFPRKGFWMKKNKDYLLNNFDALFFTDYIHKYLLKKRKGNWPKFIKSSHGPEGRGYSYKSDLLDFDFNLLYGEFIFKQLQKTKLLTEHYAIVGYPKMDFLENRPKKEIFNQKKPTVLYNPHFSKPLSSWHTLGLKVLEYFYNQSNYNLIFAPHLHLFQKTKGKQSPAVIPAKYFEAEHIFLDLGSEDSVNMTYLNASDIYLGDVSSQVYEFIIHPRPSIFLNPEKIDFQEDVNFRFWKCGEVIQDIEGLDEALRNYEENFKNYKPIQQEFTTNNFYVENGSSASQRAAQAIISYLKEQS